MMKSMCLDDPASDDADWEILDVAQYDAPDTSSSAGDDSPPLTSHARDLSDDGSDDGARAQAHGELAPRRKPGGYDSRIEQMLYENPELPIVIIEAGKSQETGGRYIVYTIKTGVSHPAEPPFTLTAADTS
jgi:hypothetical protein